MEKKYIKPAVEVMDIELEQLMVVSGDTISMDDNGEDGANAISRELILFDVIDE